MSQFINKLLGRDDEHETHSGSVVKTQAGGKTVQRQNSSGGQVVEGKTVERDGVNIKSTVSSDASSYLTMSNQQKLYDLVSRLGTTHNQIDEYSKKQSEKINEEIQREINEVVARTRRDQEELLRKANEHTAQIDQEYRAHIQKMVEEIDASKADHIAGIEKELNDKQTGILQAARAEIDQLNQKAAQLKIGALQQAEAKASSEASAITAQATEIKAQTRAHGSGTTTIKTDVTGEQTTKETIKGTPVKVEAAETTTTKTATATASNQSSGSTSRN